MAESRNNDIRSHMILQFDKQKSTKKEQNGKCVDVSALFKFGQFYDVSVLLMILTMFMMSPPSFINISHSKSQIK